MLGGTETEVYALNTYPAQKPAGTRGKYTESILARRTDSNTPFIAIFDSYRDKPRVLSIDKLSTDVQGSIAVQLLTGDSQRIILYNPLPDKAMHTRFGHTQITFIGHYAVIRLISNRVTGLSMLGSKSLTIRDTRVNCPTSSNICLTRRKSGNWSAVASADLQYETIEGKPVKAPRGSVRIDIQEADKKHVVIAAEIK
jgi:hypothetical protein